MQKYTRIKKKVVLLSKELKEFWSRYKKNKTAVFGLIIIIFLFFAAALAPWIAPFDPFKTNLPDKFLPPNMVHLMGTDQFGRDIYSRVIWGARVSLTIGFGSSGIAAILGVILGSVAGFFGGKVDELIMRILEVFMIIPTFFLVLSIAAIFGSSLWNVVILIGITGWPSTARLMRAEFLSFKERDFVEAATATGASKTHIIFSEILPNAIFPAVVNTSMLCAAAIMIEASLSFLGLGNPNNVSWGWMLNHAMDYLRYWWGSLFPGLAIIITVVAFNLIGDGLNDALNPHLKER
jgi:peptide/nickel transport system permease protein